MNVERLKQVAEYLRHLPDDGNVGFNMVVWWEETDSEWDGYEPLDYRGDPCDTAACYAGHTVYLFSGDAARTTEIEEAARELLDLTPDQAYYLFTPCIPEQELRRLTPCDAANATDRLLQGVALQDLWGSNDQTS